MRTTEVLIIGGGASGMVSAIEAAKSGKKVVLLEKKKTLGKKLLATGNGRCNFTNTLQEKACYRGEDPELAFTVIGKFDFRKTMDWFSEIGILPAFREGYVYPASFQAVSVLRALERELSLWNVEIHTEETVVSVRTEKKGSSREGFFIESDKDTYFAEMLVISTGGKASPVHGSSGDGFQIAKRMGHHLIAPVPALTSLVLEGKFRKVWAGSRIMGHVQLLDDFGNLLAEDTGEIQFVDYGISGIPVFQISRFAARALLEKKKVYVVLDSMPETPKEKIISELLRRKSRVKNINEKEKYSAADFLEGMLPDRFIKALLMLSSISFKDPVMSLSEKKIAFLAGMIKKMRLQVKEVSGFEKAQVCAGGIPLREVDPETLESKKVKNLFFTGEILDVDGMCGGYNLQWAWTSGIIAGRTIGKR